MLFWTIVNAIFLFLGLWCSIAHVAGFIRFWYRPLLLLTLASVLLSLGALLHLLHINDSNAASILALTCALLFQFKYRDDWKARGVSNRELYLFAKRDSR